jgi:putative nucleotidyltransferase with HDIG domain
MQTQGRKSLKEIGQHFNVPTLPRTAIRINRMVLDTKVGLNEIGRVVAEDAPITSRVLSIANSAYYGLAQPVLSAEEAASVVGARALQSIVMQASVMSQYEHLDGLAGSEVRGIWRHSILAARLCQHLAEKVERPLEIMPEEFYTCGLLHDIGKIVMLDTFGSEYLTLFSQSREAGQPLHLAEQEHFGYTHIDVGTLVGVRWDFPENAVQAIRYHHGPRFAILNNPCVAIVAIADQMAYRASQADRDAHDRLGALAERVLGLSQQSYDDSVAFAVRASNEVDLQEL